MKVAAIALSTLLLTSAGAHAQEASFLRSLEGTWSGTGTARLRIDSKPINLKCTFKSTSGDASLSMKGTCTGLVVVRRAVEAQLQAKGSGYSGIYVGPAGGRSGLSGARRGDSIELSVRWAKTVNGDRDALMSVTKKGANGLQLSTSDRDPATGKTVVTSSITLTRS